MSALVVDTSSWIEFFKGSPLPEIEEALEYGRVFLCPIIVAELMSGKIPSAKRKELCEFLADLPLIASDFDHWVRVGELRRKAQDYGLSISTPDAHVAQCAIDIGAKLHSLDRVFKKLETIKSIHLMCY